MKEMHAMDYCIELQYQATNGTLQFTTYYMKLQINLILSEICLTFFTFLGDRLYEFEPN